MGMMERWARRRLAKMLPRLEAELADEQTELGDMQLRQRNGGGWAARILTQERRVAKKEARVENARAALHPEKETP